MQNIEVVKKSEIEELLRCEITDEQFDEAFGYARSLALSKFTMDLCQIYCNMEKEHLTHLCKGTPTAIHIVSVPAL